MSFPTNKSLFPDLIVVFVVGATILIGLNGYYSSIEFRDLYFGVSSESLMQTFPSEILKERPFSSIYFNHIQPPLFDSVRALIAAFWSSDTIPLSHFVDIGIYLMYIGLFGLLGALVFAWVWKATNSRAYAWASMLIWVIHPSPISMAAFLDGTFLSSVLISWMIFETWLIRRGEGSVSRVVILAILCFLTRAHFQWFFVPVFGVALLLIGVDRRRILLGMGALVFVVGLYCAKQYMLFGTFSSYGFQGDYLTGLFWIEEVRELHATATDYNDICNGGSMTNEVECRKFFADRFPGELLELNFTYPAAARAVSGKWNTEDRWWLSHIHGRILKRYCASNLGYCAESLWRSVKQNFPQYWVESWESNNPVTASIPWKLTYYRLAHNYPWLIFFAVVVVATTTASRWRATPNSGGRNLSKITPILRIIGVMVIPMYIFGVTLIGSVYDGFEGGRLKFLLEPTLYTFIVVQAFLSVKYIFVGSKREFESTRD